MKKIVITGGAGYIGSHMLKEAIKRGYDVLVIDNLSTGHEEFIKGGKFLKADIQSEEAFRAIEEFKPDVIVHFAAYIAVEESVQNPIKYYENNFCNSLKLLEYAVKSGVRNFIFSSTAAVYGIKSDKPVKETDSIEPINPYGQAKANFEKALEDVSKVSDLKYVILRYFNVAGADPDGELGQISKKPTHLILRALKAAKGEIKDFGIYGTNYNTKDGTCIRDYIHVSDLVDAHFEAMKYLEEGADSDIFNCGYGKGLSVKEIVDIVKKVTGVDFPVYNYDRRPGDPPVLIANVDKIKSTLGWKPKYDDPYFIVKTAWEWEKKQS
ncbi:UDP-glucose 4-epimerase GalE [Hydrogenobaculum acidophilum]